MVIQILPDFAPRFFLAGLAVFVMFNIISLADWKDTGRDIGRGDAVYVSMATM